jgi:DNA polymerase III gamma/tau subunit
MKSVLPGLAAMLIGSQLYAQPAPSPEAGAPAPVAPPRSQLSSDEMKAKSIALAGQVRVDIQRVQHLQTVARQQKDVIKLSCVNDKFVKLKAETNIFDKANEELTQVLDTDQRFTSFTRVERAADASHKVREEAEACAGEAEVGAAESQTTVTTPEIPDDPTTGGMPGGNDPAIEPPGYASPFS